MEYLLNVSGICFNPSHSMMKISFKFSIKEKNQLVQQSSVDVYKRQVPNTTYYNSTKQCFDDIQRLLHLLILTSHSCVIVDLLSFNYYWRLVICGCLIFICKTDRKFVYSLTWTKRWYNMRHNILQKLCGGSEIICPNEQRLLVIITYLL